MSLRGALLDFFNDLVDLAVLAVDDEPPGDEHETGPFDSGIPLDVGLDLVCALLAVQVVHVKDDLHGQVMEAMVYHPSHWKSIERS